MMMIKTLRKQNKKYSSDSEDIDDDLEEEPLLIKHVEHSELKVGMFVLVKFSGVKARINYTYLCLIQRLPCLDEFDDDIVVMALNSIDMSCTTFVVDEGDISFIKGHQIIGSLEEPEIITHGTRLRYLFRAKVPVNEK
uniref:Uncharacterized protein n=1 Tax=Cacopsylla melanoneura TaxID=428564 RepID=A0A8D8TPP5_9HEMI